MAHPGDRGIRPIGGRVAAPPRRPNGRNRCHIASETFHVSDPAPRLAARSAGATADVALLRAARTDARDPEPAATRSLVERMRGVAPFRSIRVPSGEPVLVARDRRRA